MIQPDSHEVDAVASSIVEYTQQTTVWKVTCVTGLKGFKRSFLCRIKWKNSHDTLETLLLRNTKKR